MSGNEESSSRRQFTRRSFLKTTAVAATATAAALGPGEPVLRALAADYKAGQAPDAGEVVFTNGCAWTCGYCTYNVIVRDGKIVRIERRPGDDKEGREEGHACLRGRSRIFGPYNPDRIKYPMKRVGNRGEGKWERISWEEAITTITDKWKAYRSEFGKNSVAAYRGTGAYQALNSPNLGIFAGLANALEFTHVDYCTDLATSHGTERVTGVGTSVITVNDINLIGHASHVIVWGAGFCDAYMQMWRFLAKAMENGTKLTVIDPNFSTTASKADTWIAPRAGSDTVLLLAVMQYIVANDLYDKDFVRNHSTAAALVRSDNGKLLRMSDLGMSPEASKNTAASTPVDPPAVWDLSLGRAVAIDGAIEPALRGEFTVNGIATRTSFDLLVDELNKWPAAEASKISGVSVEEIEQLARTAASSDVWNYTGWSTGAYRNGAHYGQALALLAVMTGNIGKPGGSYGTSFWFYPANFAHMVPTGTFENTVPVLAMGDIMQTGKLKGEDYPIKAMYVRCGNPLISSTDANKVLEWWNKIDFVVVPEIQFTDTARHADLLLPVTHQYENEDLRLWNCASPIISVNERVIEPMFEAKGDAEITRLLAEKMGIGDLFAKSDDDFLRQMLDESPTAVERGITLDRLRKEKVIWWDDEGLFFPGGKFATETGRANIYVESPQPRLDYGQQLDDSTEHVPTWTPPHEAWEDSEAIKKYPLQLMSERPRTRWHSGEFQNVWMYDIYPEPVVKINPADAESRGIKNDDYVEVFNGRGHAVARAVIAADRKPGIMIYPKGWQASEFKAGSWSELTSSFADPWAVNCSFMDVVVDVRPWNGEV